MNTFCSSKPIAKLVPLLLQELFLKNLKMGIAAGVPSEHKLRFLYLMLEIQPGHVCWKYQAKAKGGILPFCLVHTKLVKRGTAQTCKGTASIK